MTEQQDAAAEVFDDLRPLLFTVAYELLGSAADAEDVVQDSWLRWSGVDHDERAGPARVPRPHRHPAGPQPAAHVQRRRETYVGPWLPEPCSPPPTSRTDVELADSVSLAMLVVLETLTPLERAVFVLHEVFGFEYAEIAAAMERARAAVRQLAHRARKHVEARRPRMTVGPEAPEVIERVPRPRPAAATSRRLMDLLAPDVVLLSDGGGIVSAARRPIVGPDKVARFLAGVVRKAGEIEVTWCTVNGSPSAMVSSGETVLGVGSCIVADDKVVAIHFVLNPEKLGRLRAEAPDLPGVAWRSNDRGAPLGAESAGSAADPRTCSG